MRRLETVDPIEDTTAQGGWMYADLFLALMVVFLATVSFVPNLGSGKVVDIGATPNGGPVQSYSKIFPQRLDIVFDGYDYKFLMSSIKEFTDRNGITGQSNISFAQIIAGYDAKTETPQIAIQRALGFSRSIDKSNHLLLDYASTTLSSSSDISPNRYLVQITFATRVGVTG